jgi:hypothetical protein
MLGPSADAARRNRDGVTISFSERGSRSSDHLLLSVLRLVRLIGSEKIWERGRRWLLGCNHSRPIYLPNLWRGLVLPKRIENWSLTSLQQQLVKTGGRLVKHARDYWLVLAQSHLTRRLFGGIVRSIAALPAPGG